MSVWQDPVDGAVIVKSDSSTAGFVMSTESQDIRFFYDLILLDIEMSGMTGIAYLKNGEILP